MHCQLETFIYIRNSENSLLVGSLSDSPCVSSSTSSSSSSSSSLSLLSLLSCPHHYLRLPCPFPLLPCLAHALHAYSSPGGIFGQLQPACKKCLALSMDQRSHQ